MKGQLIYMIGASGSGKDTLMKNSRKFVANNCMPVVFAHRYITRPVKPIGENHIALTTGEFETRSQNGFFAMQWESNQVKYGIGNEINDWLNSGVMVIMNGSREYLPIAWTLYPQMQVVHVQTTMEQLRARLIARGRETEQQIEEYLLRTMDYNIDYSNVMKIDSSGSETNTLRQFIEMLHDIFVMQEDV
ncbi:MAG: phosphonate metabolism protein/1,5-bisphosphokinase (PRPP-forming) PhnN [Bacteroidales bacterium]|nr:phosphonate metabolism protein/1,5-bisphosphokinase (PRPP-forming) PhnN [Bacteroidales bacterium]